MNLPGTLPEGWFSSSREESANLHRELLRELPSGHLLYGKAVKVVAHRKGSDDILCRHEDNGKRFTVIHLTWSGREEWDENHPYVERDGGFDDFLDYEREFLNKT